MKEQTNKRTLQANTLVRKQSTLHDGMAGTPRGKANIEKKKRKKENRKRNEGPTSDPETEISCRCSLKTHNKAEMQGVAD